MLCSANSDYLLYLSVMLWFNNRKSLFGFLIIMHLYLTLYLKCDTIVHRVCNKAFDKTEWIKRFIQARVDRRSFRCNISEVSLRCFDIKDKGVMCFLSWINDWKAKHKIAKTSALALCAPVAFSSPPPLSLHTAVTCAARKTPTPGGKRRSVGLASGVIGGENLWHQWKTIFFCLIFAKLV